MKIKNLKRLIALGLSTVLTISTLSACGSTKESESSKESSEAKKEESSVTSSSIEEEEEKGIVFPLEEPVTFTVHSMMNGEAKQADNLVLQEASKNANIVLDFVSEVSAADAAEKGNLIMSSGDYPDLLYKSSLSADKYGLEGILLPLEDLIREYAPNLTAELDARDAWDNLAASDGHIYSIPRLRTPFVEGSTVAFINEKWLDNLGLKAPNNSEELYEVLKAFKEQDANGNGDPNDEIPLTASNNLIRYAFYLDVGVLDLSRSMSLIDGEYVFYPTTEKYKNNYLDFFRKCYAEGLVDEQAFTQNADQVDAMGVSHDIYGIYIRDRAFENGTERDLQYINLQPEVPENIPVNPGITKNGLAITDKCENPEIIIAWIDYFFSHEGSIMGYYGIEGVTYEVGDDGVYNFINEDKYPLYTYALYGHCASPQLLPLEKDIVNPEKNPVLARKLEQEIEFLDKNVGTKLPVVNLTPEEQARSADLYANIKTYVQTYAAEVITGMKSLEDTWDEYCETLKKMGVEEYEAILQDAASR